MASHFTQQARHWLLAIRPKTLSISVAPVVVGSALAWADQQSLLWLPAAAALFTALLIQAATNLHNDAADYEKGADTAERQGPRRATAEGWFSASEVKRAAALCFGIAFAAGIYLVTVGGWPIVAIGLLSLAAGYGYTGGPRPIAYSPGGELFVFLFFGLAAVIGSYYIQTQAVSLNVLFTACAIGALAAAVLLVNNYRDLETDIKADKMTLVSHLGRRGAQQLYTLLLLLPFLLPVALTSDSPGSWLVLLALPSTLWLLQRFITERPGPHFNRLLAFTALLQLIYALLLSIGLIL